MFWWGNVRERGHLGDNMGDNIKINLQCVRWGRGGMDWTDLALGDEHVAGFCECGNEPSGSLKWWDSAPWR